MAKSAEALAREHRSGLPARGVHIRSPANGGGENHVRGRRAGVEGSYGARRIRRGVEKTLYPGRGNSHGGGEGLLGPTASRLYKGALKHSRTGKVHGSGDRALWER
jgi:hypothetical protein